MNDNKLIELYHQAEDYFFKAISEKYLNINDDATAYMTGVPVADLNIIYIKNTDNLDKILSQGKQFYDQNYLNFIVNIPEEFCTAKINHIFKDLGYFQTEKSVAMTCDLEKIQTNKTANFDSEIIIKSTDNKLNDWMLPMAAFEATDHENCIKYMNNHKLAQERNSKFYHFSLYKQEKPIASITLSIHNNIARIDDLGTLPEFQGKGYATFLMNYTLSKAKKLNATHCFLEASDAGLSIYKKLGFKTLFKSNIYSQTKRA